MSSDDVSTFSWEYPYFRRYVGNPRMVRKLIPREKSAYAASHRKSWTACLGENNELAPYATPAVSPDLVGLPPSFVFVAERDPVRDEGIDYANRLMQARISTELHVLAGIHHTTLMESKELARRAINVWLYTMKRVLC